jgi:hypothetical protein
MNLCSYLFYLRAATTQLCLLEPFREFRVFRGLKAVLRIIWRFQMPDQLTSPV